LPLRKSALYANDTISFDRLSITPGIRFDKTNTNGNATSPSLGITYRLWESTIVRAYTANGFNVPPLSYTYGDNSVNLIANPDLKVETVRSYQAGAETGALKFLWMKLTAFRSDVRDAIDFANISDTSRQALNRIRQRRQGIELEAKTAPVYNTSLTAGADFIDAKDLDTGERIQDIPTHVYDLGVVYNDERSWRARLNGRYINWNAQPEYQGKYNSPVFDLNVIKKIYQHGDASLEAFVNAHNIFNSSNYLLFIYPNPDRWFEGGLRYKF
jgi:vitamin B12 transporter